MSSSEGYPLLGAHDNASTYLQMQSCHPGLNPTISKNRKIQFSVYTGNFIQTNFSCKTEKKSAQIFDAASWQDFYNSFCKFLEGTQFENFVGI
jgi:hypothetical protein